MCLTSETKTPSTSTYDIQCYKILIPVGSEQFTTYRDFLFSVGEVVVNKAEEKTSDCFGVLMIEGGFSHSYENLSAAKKKVEEPKRKILKIYHAEIPAGVEFYKRQFEDLCSKALKIVYERD